MIVRLLKKLGRLFIILTQEDSCIEEKLHGKILIVSLPCEEHLHKAIKAVHERFRDSELKIILPESKVILVSNIIDAKNIFIVREGVSIFSYIRKLKKLGKKCFNTIVILSLNPVLVWTIFKMFKGYKLLYNYCNEWYLLRRKTFYEFLSGVAGADRERRKEVLNVDCLKIIVNIIKIPFKFLYVLYRCAKLTAYIAVHLSLISLRRLVYYKITINK